MYSNAFSRPDLRPTSLLLTGILPYYYIVRTKILSLTILSLIIGGLIHFRTSSVSSSRDIASIQQISQHLNQNIKAQPKIAITSLEKTLNTRPTSIQGMKIQWKNGSIHKISIDSNKDGKVDAVSNYKNGKKVKQKKDSNFDGKVDQVFAQIGLNTDYKWDEDFNGSLESRLRTQLVDSKQVKVTRSNKDTGSKYSYLSAYSINSNSATEGIFADECKSCQENFPKPILKTIKGSSVSEEYEYCVEIFTETETYSKEEIEELCEGAEATEDQIHEDYPSYRTHFQAVDGHLLKYQIIGNIWVSNTCDGETNKDEILKSLANAIDRGEVPGSKVKKLEAFKKSLPSKNNAERINIGLRKNLEELSNSCVPKWIEEADRDSNSSDPEVRRRAKIASQNIRSEVAGPLYALLSDKDNPIKVHCAKIDWASGIAAPSDHFSDDANSRRLFDDYMMEVVPGNKKDIQNSVVFDPTKLSSDSGTFKHEIIHLFEGAHVPPNTEKAVGCSELCSKNISAAKNLCFSSQVTDPNYSSDYDPTPFSLVLSELELKNSTDPNIAAHYNLYHMIDQNLKIYRETGSLPIDSVDMQYREKVIEGIDRLMDTTSNIITGPQEKALKKIKKILTQGSSYVDEISIEDCIEALDSLHGNHSH
ncbi:MAG: hypothetical protein AB8E15_01030 [Bdellovibrionales bacterium]